MASYNRAILIGNLGRDPELRYTSNQTAVVNMSIATTDRRTGKDGQALEFTEWHKIVVYGKQAESCAKFLSKGSSICVEGRISTRKWDDKATGVTRSSTEIIAEKVQFLGGKKDSQGQRHEADNIPDEETGYLGGMDDVPF